MYMTRQKQQFMFIGVENTDVWSMLKELFHLESKTLADKRRLKRLTLDYQAKGATGSMVRECAELYRVHRPWREWHCSAEAVLKHWGDLRHELTKRMEIKKRGEAEWRKAADRCKALERDAAERQAAWDKKHEQGEQ